MRDKILITLIMFVGGLFVLSLSLEAAGLTNTVSGIERKGE